MIEKFNLWSFWWNKRKKIIELCMECKISKENHNKLDHEFRIND